MDLLLVEDNPDDETLILRVLDKLALGSRTVVVRDGAEALNRLLGLGPFAGPGAPALPKVVLLDLKLPKMDGLEVLRELRRHERTSRLPVVMLSSSKAERDIAACYELGANSYVSKPLEYGEFATQLGELASYWLKRNEIPLSELR